MSLNFFIKAHNYVIAHGFQWEIDLVENRYLKDITAQDLKWNFLFCVLGSSGLNNKVVQKQYDKFIFEYNSGKNAFDIIPNSRIRNAVKYVWSHKDEILSNIIRKNTDLDRIEYIKTLPQMGPKTARHFARNLGIDCVKPDIWMERLAYEYGFCENDGKTLYPERMCKSIQEQLPQLGIPQYRIGTIDVILWRYCVLTGELK